MKKSGILLGMLVGSGLCVGGYALVSKRTKKNADKLINNILDKANEYTQNNI